MINIVPAMGMLLTAWYIDTIAPGHPATGLSLLVACVYFGIFTVAITKRMRGKGFNEKEDLDE